jgi:uncharacterized protein (DUF924 family)
MSQHNQTRNDVDRLLDFWFGAQTDGYSGDAARRRWFSADPAFDQQITRQFGGLPDAAARGALTHWLGDARSRLAFVIVTDQFARQIHRGLAAAFATDALALAAARDGIEIGHDRTLSVDERSFFYLPFEHSESRVDQHTSVGLFAQLLDDTPQTHRAISAESLRYARGHRDIVLEFGRFPHRNACLARASSAAELAFLRSASRFGQ